MTPSEYLVSYGAAGDIGRFRTGEPLACRRGDRVVIRAREGLEIGVVLCDATPRHARMLENQDTGELLRRATAEDEVIAGGVRIRARRLLDEARQLAAELNLPLEILDVEIRLDGHHVTFYYLRWAAGDERPLVSALSKRYEVMVALRDLALPQGASACGRPDCGQSSGGCTTCSAGGGCATGCGSKAIGPDVKDYFLSLRRKMEESKRVPLT